MIPDDSKVKAVQEWPRPTQVSEVHQFLGLASYYRRYIENFSDISLTHLTQKGVPFIWNKNCEDAFCGLKTRLTQAPVLAYPKLGPEASPFILQTDASAVGLGAVLEQDKRVIAYASRTLTKSEQYYSVIQKECLAIVYALKQFRHGRKFQLVTDHAPLQWLSAQKMEGMMGFSYARVQF